MPYRSKFNQDEGDFLTGTRICKVCKIRKSMTEFHWGMNHSCRVRMCKLCSYVKQKKHYDERKEERKEVNFAGSLRRKYGITVEEWSRLLKLQNNKCLICDTSLTRKNIHVDHSHKTDLVRGLLCFSCNTAIGKFRDSIEYLKKAIKYLEKPPTKVNYRSKKLTHGEYKEIRSKATQKWYDSEAGKESLRKRIMANSGENNAVAKLTDKEAEEIPLKYATGKFTYNELGALYGVGGGTVNRLLNIYRKKYGYNGKIPHARPIYYQNNIKKTI